MDPGPQQRLSLDRKALHGCRDIHIGASYDQYAHFVPPTFLLNCFPKTFYYTYCTIKANKVKVLCCINITIDLCESSPNPLYPLYISRPEICSPGIFTIVGNSIIINYRERFSFLSARGIFPWYSRKRGGVPSICRAVQSQGAGLILCIRRNELRVPGHGHGRSCDTQASPWSVSKKSPDCPAFPPPLCLKSSTARLTISARRPSIRF